MGACYCTGGCMDGRGCAARGIPPKPLDPPWPPGQIVVNPAPLTEEKVRQIIREELDRGRQD